MYSADKRLRMDAIMLLVCFIALAAASAVLLVPVSLPQAQAELKVNINTADAAELSMLPGIGAARAQAIIDYREAHGGFRSPEEIMEVHGIGEGIYEEIEKYIAIR